VQERFRGVEELDSLSKMARTARGVDVQLRWQEGVGWKFTEVGGGLGMVGDEEGNGRGITREKRGAQLG